MKNISNISFQVPMQQNAMGNLISLASIVIDGMFLVSEIEICSLSGSMADVYVLDLSYGCKVTKLKLRKKKNEL